MRGNYLVVVVAVWAILACSSPMRPAAAPAARNQPSWLLLRIDAVRVAGQRPGKAGTWDGATEKGDSKAGCKLLGLAAGAISGGTAGTATSLLCRLAATGSDRQAQKDPRAPDLLIKVAVGAQTVYRTYIAEDTYSHIFLYSVVVPVEAIPHSGLQIIVLDQDGDDIGEGELIGSVRIAGAQLTAMTRAASPVMTLQDGPLEKLELSVAPYVEGVRTGTYLHPVTEPLAAIPQLRVHAGEIVELRAAGRYSVANNEELLDPAGYRNGSRRSYNLPGLAFARMAHGAAVASIGHPGASATLAVDGCVTLISPFAGTLHVGVNDEDRFNNKGVLSFEAVIRPPRREDWSRAGLLSACQAGEER